MLGNVNISLSIQKNEKITHSDIKFLIIFIEIFNTLIFRYSADNIVK